MSRIRKIGVIMNGVTGRMGTNQHLLRSILPIIEQGGIMLSNGDRIIPDPVLVGRSEDKLRALSSRSGVENFTTDLDSVLKDEKYSIYFDAQTTERRAPSVLRALEYGKHIYCEKPSALDSATALNLYHAAENAGVVHGIVQDKLWLPGLVKLKTVRDSGFFGDILSVRGEFGYWVFEGDTIEAQRPSWNYRKEDGGGIIYDMFCHWRYVLDSLFGNVKAVSAVGKTHIPYRVNEKGERYACTAEDAAYATFELEGGIIAQFNSSWAVRVRRDDLLTIQVDGTKGSAVATLGKCFIQPYNATPMNVWNPDIDSSINHFDGWQEVPDTQKYENAFKAQWELFLRAAAEKRLFEWGLMAGVEGIQLAEKGIESWQKRQWVDIPDILL
ncbi:MAG: Gfo/Idh/MocA family oxidoreductase [Spirochaetaceae bacterium]|nr:Gfo/Idh/MocA family oxidoreductase [Spirochaetaceae bacterium]MDT8297041.1 Gfo/Idh/MocA family oxidoreductase [Spirochaetaceae bacterium]